MCWLCGHPLTFTVLIQSNLNDQESQGGYKCLVETLGWDFVMSNAQLLKKRQMPGGTRRYPPKTLKDGRMMQFSKLVYFKQDSLGWEVFSCLYIQWKRISCKNPTSLRLRTHWELFFPTSLGWGVGGETLNEGLPIGRLQPCTHVSDKPPQAPVIPGQLIQREGVRDGWGGGEESAAGKESGSTPKGREDKRKHFRAFDLLLHRRHRCRTSSVQMGCAGLVRFCRVFCLKFIQNILNQQTVRVEMSWVLVPKHSNKRLTNPHRWPRFHPSTSPWNDWK